MANVTKDDVAQLAALSSLQLTDEETDSLAVDISNILGYVQQLSELDTSGVEPTYQVTDLQNVWREDIVVDAGVNREALLALAPDQAEHQIKVPKVL